MYLCCRVNKLRQQSVHRGPVARAVAGLMPCLKAGGRCGKHKETTRYEVETRSKGTDTELPSVASFPRSQGWP